jgi:hypothetical protein
MAHSRHRLMFQRPCSSRVQLAEACRQTRLPASQDTRPAWCRGLGGQFVRSAAWKMSCMTKRVPAKLDDTTRHQYPGPRLDTALAAVGTWTRRFWARARCDRIHTQYTVCAEYLVHMYTPRIERPRNRPSTGTSPFARRPGFPGLRWGAGGIWRDRKTGEGPSGGESTPGSPSPPHWPPVRCRQWLAGFLPPGLQGCSLLRRWARGRSQVGADWRYNGGRIE